LRFAKTKDKEARAEEVEDRGSEDAADALLLLGEEILHSG